MSQKLSDKIIEKAIELFNKDGILSTSLRRISKELNISDGHLRYYFKTKEDLIIAMYDYMLKSIEPIEEEIPKDIPLWKNIILQLKGSFTIQRRFSWLYIESGMLFKKYPNLKSKYFEINNIHRDYFFRENKKNVEIGIFKSTLSDCELILLREQFMFILNSWISYNSIQTDSNNIEEHHVEYYVALIIGLIRPYLNEQLQIELEPWVNEKIKLI